MENVILSEKEIQSIKLSDYPIVGKHSEAQVLCKLAQLKLLRILKEPCTEHLYNVTWTSKGYHRHRWDCPECMKQIEKEIER